MATCPQCGNMLAPQDTTCSQCGTVFAAQQGYASNLQLSTNRSLLKLILLSLITFGIYGIVIYSKMGEDLNLIAGKYDGKRTMHYCLLIFLLLPLTFGIAYFVWNHKISNRIGAELARRNIDYSISASTYWGWGFFGSLIIVGPFIYAHKLLTSMNYLCYDYNQKGN